ncbi:hypothetical protein RV12_GL001455 [Enterococcus quebecensis]|nr:hypothetical protein RV12_GL001455 [Enterococcus quebecensis]
MKKKLVFWVSQFLEPNKKVPINFENMYVHDQLNNYPNGERM